MSWNDIGMYFIFGIGIIIALFLLLIIFTEIMWALQNYGPEYTIKAKVKSQSHKASQTHMGTGISSGGQVVVTSTTDEEEYDTTFLLEDGRIWSEDDVIIFSKVSHGDKVILTFADKKLWGDTRHYLQKCEKL